MSDERDYDALADATWQEYMTDKMIDEATEELRRQVAKLQKENEILKDHLTLALSFCPKGPVLEGLTPDFYHTLDYNEELKLQEKIDQARDYLNKCGD